MVGVSRVRTLTGKEIELDIEPEYKVGLPHNIHVHQGYITCRPQAEQSTAGLTHKRASRGEGGYPTCAAAVDLRRQANVRLSGPPRVIRSLAREADSALIRCRADDKTAAEYNLEGGATLHLVLALRGGTA